MQRRLRAAAYTPEGPDALALFRSYDKHSAGGLSLGAFKAVARKGAKTTEEDLGDNELVRLWKLLLANGGTLIPAPATKASAGDGHAKAPRLLSADAFVAFVHGEGHLDLLQCCLHNSGAMTPARPTTAPARSGSSDRRKTPPSVRRAAAAAAVTEVPPLPLAASLEAAATSRSASGEEWAALGELSAPDEDGQASLATLRQRVSALQHLAKEAERGRERAIAEARVLQQQRDFFQESTKEALSLVAALTERYITSSSESGSLETG